MTATPFAIFSCDLDTIDRHLEGYGIEGLPACDLIYRTQIALRSALHDPSLYHRAPPALKGRIRSSLQKEAKGSQSSHTATSSGLISW